MKKIFRNINYKQLVVIIALLFVMVILTCCLESCFDFLPGPYHYINVDIDEKLLEEIEKIPGIKSFKVEQWARGKNVFYDRYYCYIDMDPVPTVEETKVITEEIAACLFQHPDICHRFFGICEDIEINFTNGEDVILSLESFRWEHFETWNDSGDYSQEVFFIDLSDESTGTIFLPNGEQTTCKVIGNEYMACFVIPLMCCCDNLNVDYKYDEDCLIIFTKDMSDRVEIDTISGKIKYYEIQEDGTEHTEIIDKWYDWYKYENDNGDKEQYNYYFCSGEEVYVDNIMFEAILDCLDVEAGFKADYDRGEISIG